MNLPPRKGHPLTSIWILGVSLLLLPGCSRHQDAAPRSPRESLQGMQVHSNFRVELFASEPDVVAPVEMAYPVRARFQVLDLLLDRKERLGLLLDGLIVNETSNSLTLRRPEAEDLTLLKAAVAEVRASSVSLMPDGFEDGINPRQMADLIAYLQGANLQ